MNSRLTIAVLIFQILITINGSSQSPCEYKVWGHVYDGTNNEPILGASVTIMGLELGTITNEDGYFEILGLCQEDLDLSFTYLGYKNLKHHHDHHHGSIEIYLAPESTILQSIIVEASHNPSSIHTSSIAGIPLERIQISRTKSLAHLVAKLPGVASMKTGNNIQIPIIHGMSGNRNIVLQDGVRHEYQNWDDAHAPEISLGGAQRVEILKGAAAVRYGIEAMGGVILLQSENIEFDQPHRLHLGVEGSSNGRAYGGFMGWSKGYQNWSVQAFADYNKQGDLHAPSYNLSNTSKENISAFTKLQYHLTHNWDLFQSLSFYQSQLGTLRGAVNANLNDLILALEAGSPLDNSSFTYNVQNPKQALSHIKSQTHLRYLANHQSLLLTYTYQQNNRQEFDIRRGNNSAIPNLDLTLHSQTLEALYNHPSLGHHITGKVGIQIGLNNNINNPGTNTVPFIPNYTRQQVGLFAIEQWEHDKHIVEIGARFDLIASDIIGRKPDNTLYIDQFSWNNGSIVLGYQYKINGAQSIKFNIGSAWRPPNMADLYRFGRNGVILEYGLWRYQITDDNQIDASDVQSSTNSQAQIEKGIKYILSHQLTKNKLNIQTDLYFHNINQFIYSRPIGVSSTVRGSAPLYGYAQADAIFAGIDLQASYVPHPTWSHEFQGAFIYGEQKNQGGYFVGTPPPSLSYGLKHKRQIGSWNTTVELRFPFTFKQPFAPQYFTPRELLNAYNDNQTLASEEDFDLAPAPPAYLLLEGHITLNNGPLGISLIGENLLNKEYRSYTDRQRYYAYDLGRNITLQINYRL